MNTARDIITYAEEHNIHISTREGQLILNAPKEVLTDEFLERAKQHKKQIITHITKDTVNGISLSELKEVAGKDWPDIEHDQKMIETLAASISVRHMRERGEIPPDYIHKAVCDGCGPVWLFVSGHVQGCPWCFNRVTGLPIPRPMDKT